MNIDVDARAGGMKVFNEGNHAGQDNPHPQYVNTKILYAIPPITDLTKLYNHFCTIKLLASDRYAFVNFAIYNLNNVTSDEIEYANVAVRVNCSGSLSAGTKNVTVKVLSYANFDLKNIIAVVTQNDSNGYEVQLYLRQWETYKGYRIQPITEYSGQPYLTVRIDFLDNSAAELALPSGTQVLPSRLFDELRKMVYTVPAQNGGIYVKLCDIDLLTNTASKTLKLNITSSNSGDMPFSATAIFKTKILNLSAGGTTVTSSITVLDTTDAASRSSFIAVITQNDATKVTVSLYLTTVRTNEIYYFNITEETLDEINTESNIVIPNTFVWAAALPTGTQVLAQGRKTLFLGPDCSITRDSSYNLTTPNGLKVGSTGLFGSTYFQIGTYYLWVDASGRLKMKNGIPSSDGDGTIVGSQT